MAKNTALIWLVSIASFSLLAAVSVYLFARFYPPEVLEPFQVAGTVLASYTGIFGSAPSFFYTLALCLIIGACASNHSTAILHSFLWIGLSLFLELTQHPTFAGFLSTWFPRVLPESTWELIEPYWTRGVFDPIDLVATLVGGLIAITLITHLPNEYRNADC
jgi:hypothetical protein